MVFVITNLLYYELSIQVILLYSTFVSVRIWAAFLFLKSNTRNKKFCFD